MSITFGIYDFFSYTIPGVLYIVVANQLLALFGMKGIPFDILNTDLGGIVLWAVVAYVIGHLMDFFGFQWYCLVNKFHAETKAMREFKDDNKNLDVNFTIHERKMLFSVIRHKNMDLAQYIDSFKAVSIMLSNVSLGLLLMSLVQILSMVLKGFTWAALIVAVIGLILSYAAINRSALFNEWHWAYVYRHARQYGKSVAEMVDGKDAPNLKKGRTNHVSKTGEKVG